MADLISVREAQEHIIQRLIPVGLITADLFACAGKVLGEDIFSDQDHPIFDTASMDGYAIRGRDTSGATSNNPIKLDVIGDIPAGSSPDVHIGPFKAARIMTGAPVPTGADVVVPQEWTNVNTDQPGSPLPAFIEVKQPLKPGSYIRPRGQDLQAGQKVLQAGKRLQPQDAGVLALLGKMEVPIYRAPKIAVLSTGDELIDPGAPLSPGKIRDINTYTITLLARRHGAEVIMTGTAPDRPDEIESWLNHAVSAGADFLVTTAGVSVGAYDFVKKIIEKNGFLTFWRADMRPGKPIAFGEYRRVPFMGLPGNPVSAFVCFLVFGLPAIAKLSGDTDYHPIFTQAVLEHEIESDGRESYLRAVVTRENEKNRVHLTGHQGSGNIFSLCQANALLIVPSGVKSLPAGTEASVWMLDKFD